MGCERICGATSSFILWSSSRHAPAAAAELDLDLDLDLELERDLELKLDLDEIYKRVKQEGRTAARNTKCP